MSAEDNVKVVQAIYEAFGRGDVPGVLSHVAGDVEWVAPAQPGADIAGTYHGPDGVGEFFQKLMAAENIEKLDFTDWLTGADSVAVVGQVAGKARSTGKAFSADFIHYWKVRDGKAVFFRDYLDSYVMIEAFRA
jgi:ketosteroid isomerase-like protein